MTTETFELSRSQQAVFRMESFLSGRGFYAGGIARLRGEISSEQLTKAADQIRSSIDIFRIGFVANGPGAQWYGIRHDAPQTEIETVDLSRYPDPEQAFESWAQRQLLLNEDLSLAPIRLFVVRFHPDQSGWFVKAHHAAVDGVALSNLMEQALTAVEGIAGRESPPFAIVAERERIYERSHRAARDAAYWHSVFGASAVGSAPEIVARFPIGDYRGLEPRSRRVRIELTEGQNELLRRFVLHGGSLFRLVFAAVAHVQMVIEDGNGVLLQAPMQNRWRDDERRAIAMAVAPVLVPVFRKAGATVAECYRALKQPLQKAIVHSRCAPATRWRDFASPEWQQIIPVFGVSYQTGEFRRSIAGIDVEIDHVQAVEAMFATIHIHHRFEERGFGLEADFRRIWSSHQCRALLDAVLTQVIEAAAEILGVPVRARAAATAAAEPISMHLRTAFECYADRVLFKRAAAADLTYRQGARWISAFAAALRHEHAARLEKGPVLLLGRRSPEVTLAYLACLQAHIPVVVACPTTPIARLEIMVRNSGVMCCVHVSADQVLAKALALPSFCIPAAWDFPEEAMPPSAEAQGAASQLAYILYTSGSSGEPKGVAISQAALAGYALAAKKAYASQVPFNAPLFTSFGFDLTQTSILIPVLSGGFMQTHAMDLLDSPTLLRTLLADESLTGIKCTPAHLALLLEQGAKRQNPLTCVVGGENLSSALVHRALCWLPRGSRVINEYGPTEATVGCSVYEASAPDGDQLAQTAITPIGVPLGSAEMSIRDSWGQVVAAGFNGEIWVGGPVLADGYLNDAAQTQARFVHDHGRRWFRTGDLGMQDSGGVFHCLGRIDDEFKMRGHRIHPAEIEKAVETVLATLHPRGYGWALKALKLNVGSSEMVALCSNEPVPHDHPEFRRRLKERIADAWLPGAYCTVQPWPINANGKVDLSALAAAAGELISIRAGERPSSNAVNEEKSQRFELPAWLDAAFLLPIWPEAVDLSRAFLDLGGDSIKAIRLAALLAREGVRISASELLMASSLGVALETACARPSADVAIESAAAAAVEAGWLRYLPSVRWLREQRFSHVERLQQGIVVELSPSLCAEQIHAAVATVKARHKIFSVRADSHLTDFHFSSLETEQSQSESPQSESPQSESSVCHILQAGERLEHRRERLQSEICLAKRPSAHEVVIDPHVDKAYLLWACHHLLCDVHSWVYLLDELDEALSDAATDAAVSAEYGAFLWGKWLKDHVPEFELRHAEQVVKRPAAAAVEMVLSVAGERLRTMEQRCKAERSQLIAAALLEVARRDGVLPDESTVLIEGHGRMFAEAQLPVAWSTHLASAVGWFTSFTPIRLGDVAGGSPGFLRALKWQLHQSVAWPRRLGSADGYGRPTLCVNDIGSGLSSDRSWRNFGLVAALSGGARHPHENSVADFELLVREEQGSGAVRVELRLGTPEADVQAARSYLQQLSDTLSTWDRALADRDGEHRSRHALIPADFPFCQLTQAELDAITHGALA